jgi:integrase
VRPDELQGLTWRDVDFTAGTVSVSKAIDARTGEPKALPKTERAVRDVPIDPALMPLLLRMHEGGAGDDAYVLPVLLARNDKFRAKQILEPLRLAGITRARLFADTATLMPVNFRSCRDTGIAWLALPGPRMLSLHAMQRRCGHEDIDTTNGSVKMAERTSAAPPGSPSRRCPGPSSHRLTIV